MTELEIEMNMKLRSEFDAIQVGYNDKPEFFTGVQYFSIMP